MTPSGNSVARSESGTGRSTPLPAEFAGETGVVFAPPELVRALHGILRAESDGAWRRTSHAAGLAAGRAMAAGADRDLARRQQPRLTDQSLENGLTLVERHFSAQGWGVLTADLSLAPEHGLVVARLRHSPVVAALGHGAELADAMAAGFLQAFLEHVSGQPLSALEIGCVRTGAPHCTFVITSPDRLDPVAGLVGRASPEEIIERLKG